LITSYDITIFFKFISMMIRDWMIIWNYCT